MMKAMRKNEGLTSLNGILLINKPQGKSSNAVLQQVKRLLGVKKAGHTGSLDPLATGMLPLCLGEATKLSQYLLDADKCYQTSALLGIKTDSADATGKVIKSVTGFSIAEKQLLNVISAFKGSGQQVPSMFSALKHQGIPLYKYARQGVEIERQPRSINVHELLLTSFDGKSFSLQVRCSKGTYIRNLVEDIGEHLGVGAHVTALHRLYTGGFEQQKMYTPDELEAMAPAERLNLVLPMDMAVKHLPSLVLDSCETTAIRQGKPLQCQTLNEIVEGTVRLYNELGAFVGLGELSGQQVLRARRLLVEPV